MKKFLPVLALLFFARPAEARGCVEQSDIVGERLCSRYGDGWAVEKEYPIAFRFGFRYALVNPAGHTFVEAFKPSQRPKNYVGYRYPGAALGTDALAAGGADGGVTFFVVGQLYLGLEGSFSLGSTTTQPVATKTFLLSNDGAVDVLMIHGGAPIGYRVPLGRASLRSETFFGGTLVDVTQTARPLNGSGKPDSRTSEAVVGLIEMRVAADIWFTQHISFGAYAGMNMLATTDRALGFSLTFHNRAFDGDATLW